MKDTFIRVNLNKVSNCIGLILEIKNDMMHIINFHFVPALNFKKALFVFE